MNIIRRIYHRFVPSICRRFIRHPKDAIEILKVKYCKINMFALNRSEYREHKIIVSLTSYPKRFDNLYITVKSLMRQTVKPDEIILYLGNDSEEYMLPSSLLALKKYGLKIVFKDENLGSYKKFYYAFQEYPNDYVITVDDDLIYDSNLIESLYTNAMRSPTCVIARRVHRILLDDKGNVAPYMKWCMECDSILYPSHALFATTGAGTLFRPRLLNKIWSRKDLFLQLCPNADDVWIKFVTVMSDVKVLYVASKRIMPIEIVEDPFEGLKVINMSERNDLYISKLQKSLNVNLAEYVKS